MPRRSASSATSFSNEQCREGWSDFPIPQSEATNDCSTSTLAQRERDERRDRWRRRRHRAWGVAKTVFFLFVGAAVVVDFVDKVLDWMT